MAVYGEISMSKVYRWISDRWNNWNREEREYKKRMRKFEEEYSLFVTKENQEKFFLEKIPCINDDIGYTPFDPHYLYHTAWAARILSQSQPKKHIDVSSILYFATIISAFIETDYYEFNPVNLNLSNLSSIKGDILHLPFETGSVNSLSCMHVVEHIGLGRYGDPIDFYGDQLAIKELQRVVMKGGQLLFVVPVGRERICFNAHRVYYPETICELFSELELKEFSLIPDDAFERGIIKNASFALGREQEYGCGCFWFVKSV